MMSFELLFSSKGRLGRNEFLQAMILLLGFQVVCSVLVALSSSTVVMIGFINLALLFPYACVFSKRFHDNGKSGYWFISILIIYFGVSSVIANFWGIFYADYMQSFSKDFQSIIDRRDLPALTILMQQNAIEMFGPNLITMAVQTLATALPAAALGSDPKANTYGPSGNE